ncbi:MAG: homoserine dehydrogenase [SAR324 cluster bacterium]|nr:homoserine dehydrogenase [SAR324 cluster bacterium]
MVKKNINLGLIGLGTVGIGFIDLLTAHKKLIFDKTNLNFIIKKAVVSSLSKKRPPCTDSIELSTNPDFVTEDPDIDVVIELSGDISLALQALKNTLSHKKGFITANKALIAEKGEQVWPLFKQHNSLIGFEACVGGSLPIVKVIKESFMPEQISLVATIINGTANYILSTMEQEQLDFAEALKLAITKGYAEPDPTMDIDGTDTAHKINIIANLAFHRAFKFTKIDKEGIERITKKDLIYAKSLGYVVKLLGIAKKTDSNEHHIAVHPTMIKESSSLAPVRGVYNAALIRGDFLGDSLLYGEGAGAHPTAVAVVSDLIDVVSNLTFVESAKMRHFPQTAYNFQKGELLAVTELKHEHYLRLTVKDSIGVLSKVAKIISANEISISKILQQESSINDNQHLIDLIVITHRAKDVNIKKSIAQIDAEDFSCISPVHLRIEKNI